MNADFFWKLFMRTGSPEVYLMYNKAKNGEEDYVPDYQSIGASGKGI